MRELRGKNGMLTGASRGLGPYIGRALARQGVNLTLSARGPSKDQLEQVSNDLRALGVHVVAAYGDITSPTDREHIAMIAQREMGRIDILINNAGYEHYAPFRLLDAETIQRTIETNLIGTLEMTRLILPQMLAAHLGHVVSIASVSGKSPVAYNSIYSASKAAIIFWNAALRDELEGTGVGMSVVCPGYVSGVGMHARYGIKPPRIAGEVSPEQVANAVVQAIRENRPELLVWPSHMIRPMLAVKELAPAFVRAVYSHFGMYEFFKRKAEIDARKM